MMPHLITLIQDRLCVGVDLHKCQMTIAILNPTTGEVRYEKIATKCRDKIVAFFEALPKPNIIAIARMMLRWMWAAERDRTRYERRAA